MLHSCACLHLGCRKISSSEQSTGRQHETRHASTCLNPVTHCLVIAATKQNSSTSLRRQFVASVTPSYSSACYRENVVPSLRETRAWNRHRFSAVIFGPCVSGIASRLSWCTVSRLTPVTSFVLRPRRCSIVVKTETSGRRRDEPGNDVTERGAQGRRWRHRTGIPASRVVAPCQVRSRLFSYTSSPITSFVSQSSEKFASEYYAIWIVSDVDLGCFWPFSFFSCLPAIHSQCREQSEWNLINEN